MVSDEQSKEIQDTEDTQDEVSASPGRLLKAGREKQGLSQQQVADKLFLKAEQINDLEHDRIDEKTSVTFTRGYIRNYAKQLGLSQEEVIAEFDRLHATSKQPAKLQSFSRRVAKQNHDDRWMMVTYGIVLLLLAGVVVWWYQQTGNEALVDEATSTIEQTASQLTTANNDNTRAAAEPSQGPETSGAGASSESDNETQTESLPAQSPDQPGKPDVTDVDSQPQQQAPASETETDGQASDDTSGNDGTPINMVFRFADDCWVNIEDGSGEAIAYGIKQAGRVMEISGVPPVEVTLGAPDNVAITVNGEAVDMSVYPGGRTARFSLPIQD